MKDHNKIYLKEWQTFFSKLWSILVYSKTLKKKERSRRLLPVSKLRKWMQRFMELLTLYIYMLEFFYYIVLEPRYTNV